GRHGRPWSAAAPGTAGAPPGRVRTARRSTSAARSPCLDSGAPGARGACGAAGAGRARPWRGRRRPAHGPVGPDVTVWHATGLQVLAGPERYSKPRHHVDWGTPHTDSRRSGPDAFKAGLRETVEARPIAPGARAAPPGARRGRGRTRGTTRTATSPTAADGEGPRGSGAGAV